MKLRATPQSFAGLLSTSPPSFRVHATKMALSAFATLFNRSCMTMTTV
jgi:hypothetical protein